MDKKEEDSQSVKCFGPFHPDSQCDICGRKETCQEEKKSYHKISDAAIFYTLPNVSASAKAVYLAILVHLRNDKKDPKYGQCYPGFERIAELARLKTARYVGKYVKELEEHGLIKHWSKVEIKDGKWVSYHYFKDMTYDVWR